METNEKLRRELIKKIETTFANTPYPGSNIGDEMELGRFKRKKSKDVTLEDIFSVESLHSFSPKGLQYCLPAFLLATLHSPESSQGIRLGIIEFFDMGENWENRVKHSEDWRFTEKQRAAIRYFFESYEQIFPPPETDYISRVDKKRHEALQRCIKYWQKYG